MLCGMFGGMLGGMFGGTLCCMFCWSCCPVMPGGADISGCPSTLLAEGIIDGGGMPRGGMLKSGGRAPPNARFRATLTGAVREEREEAGQLLSPVIADSNSSSEKRRGGQLSHHSNKREKMRNYDKRKKGQNNKPNRSNGKFKQVEIDVLTKPLQSPRRTTLQQIFFPSELPDSRKYSYQVLPAP